MNEANKILDTYNVIVGSAVTVLAAIFGSHWYLFIFFLVFNVFDYVTGLMKARKLKKESSSVGLAGIIKKLGYWIIIATAFLTAYALTALGEDILNIDLSFLALLGWFTLAVFPAALAGALMAFLLWDFPPAKLHPGRCGCLYAAGAIGCIPLCIGYAELSIPLALPFWVEGGMVVLQVLFCRWKGRPLFAAAPLHCWLEKRGMSAVNIFYSLCALSVCGLALAVCLARWA